MAFRVGKIRRKQTSSRAKSKAKGSYTRTTLHHQKGMHRGRRGQIR